VDETVASVWKYVGTGVVFGVVAAAEEKLLVRSVT